MEALREFLKGWAGKGLLILFLLPLAITGFESIVRQGDDPNAVAKVGEQNIDASTLQNTVNQRREALLESVKGDASLINDEALRRQVLDSLIDRYLILQQAQQLGFSISDAALTQMLATDPNFQGADGKFSNEIFGNYLRSQGINKDQLFAILRNDRVVPAFSRSILSTGIFANSGIEHFINMQTQVRPLWVARLDWQQFAPQVQVSDQDINAYYQANKDNLKSEEMVNLAYLELDKNTLSVPAPTAEELQTQYQQYLKDSGNEVSYDVAMILVNGDKAKATLNDVKKQFDDKKADFATLAKQYSQDEGSKNDGGKIGTISKAMFPNDFDKIVNAIKNLKTGKITAPIQTNYGYHLFQLVKINGQNPPSLDSVKATLVEQITQQKREAMYQDLIGKINNDAVSGANINEIASRYKLNIKHINDYSKLNNTSVLNQPAVISTAFDNTLIHDKTVSVGVELPNRVLWVQPNDYRPVKSLSQTEAIPVIKQRLTVEKAKAIAKIKAQSIADNINKNNSLDNVGADFQNLGMTNRLNPALLDEERGVAFTMASADNKLTATTQTTEQGVSVIVGGKITSDNRQVTPQIRQQTAQMLRDNIGQSQFEDYLAYLRSVHEVKINEQNVQTH